MQLAGSKDSGSVYTESDREVQNRNSGQNGNPRLIEVKEKKTSLSGSKTHPLWYADVGREAKKEIVNESHLRNIGVNRCVCMWQRWDSVRRRVIYQD